MSEANKAIVTKIMESFLNGNIETVSKFLDENIKWNIVGLPEIRGKFNFIKTMQMMERENFREIKFKNIIAEGNYVVVENSGSTDDEFCNTSPESNHPSYCDVYLLNKGKVLKLTSYIVDVTFHNDE